jgi:hypothetical protein
MAWPSVLIYTRTTAQILASVILSRSQRPSGFSSAPLDLKGQSFDYTFPAHSITMLRFQMEADGGRWRHMDERTRRLEGWAILMHQPLAIYLV